MKPFDDRALPPGFAWGSEEPHHPWSGPGARSLLGHLMGNGAELRRRPVLEIVEVLGRAGARFLDHRDPLRREVEERVMAEAGYSRAMARTVVEGMARDWTRERLLGALAADFPDPSVLDRFTMTRQGDRTRAVGAPLTLQIVSGSVPGVGATALLRSLLVKSPTLVKPGAGDVALPVLLARAIAEEDEGIGGSLAVVYWPGSEGGELEREALRTAGRVVLYGGDDSVVALRTRLPVTTPLVTYHHRVSVAVVGRGVLETSGAARESAMAAARSVSLFEQRGCVSPHVVWVEEGGRVSPKEWARELAKALDSVAVDLPATSPTAELAGEIQQFRGVAEMRVSTGEGSELLRSAGLEWTVSFEPDPVFAPSCLGRTVRVKSIDSILEVPRHLAPISRHLQTVGVEGAGGRAEQLATSLAEAGVTRITRFSAQPFPPAWWRHDGRGPLEVLVSWTAWEGE